VTVRPLVLAAVLGLAAVVPVAVGATEPAPMVSGRVFEEPPKPAAAERPVTDTVVTLVPRSPEFRDRLEQIKRHARDSLASYTKAVADIRRERQAYERGFNNVEGLPVRSMTVDSAGRFAFDAVSAGDWLVIGWHSTFVKAPGDAVTKKDRSRFTLTPHAPGFQKVTIWLVDVTIGTSPAEPIDLTDRNAWFSGVLEEGKSTPGH
jgi:DNA-binding transcriptional LysR family regulator